MHTRPFRTRLISLLTLCVVLGGIWATLPGATPGAAARRRAYVAAPASTAVLTYKNDVYHTGWNSHETILNPNNVNANQFGRRVTYPVQGQVDAQPLFVPNLMVNGAQHNVVFVATESDNLYAFDADATTPGQPLWNVSLLYPGEVTMKATQLSCPDLQPESGITGTPVIDPTTNTMYIVSFANTTPNGNPTPIYRLHAIDITTGRDKSAPIVISGSAQGRNGPVPFNPLRERQRAALLLTNGQIYVAFGSFCDNDPYDGRIYSYTYNGYAFQAQNLYDAAPNGDMKSGLWGAGGAITADNNGNIYGITANGTFNLNTGGTESGDSFIKLNSKLQRQDYFTPYQQSCLQRNDVDLGSGGPLVIPGENRVIGGGKEGRIYNVDTTNMGQYTADPKLDALLQNPQFAYRCSTTDPQLESAMEAELNRTDVDKVYQESAPGVTGYGLYSTPSYWRSDTGEYVYFIGNGSPAKAFSLTNGRLSAAPTSISTDYFGNMTANSVISSNGTASNSGILWAEDRLTNTLRAYKASNLAIRLYTSSTNTARDGLGTVQKFNTPTVANGEVFVGTSNSLVIYGLNPSTNGGGSTAPSNPPFNDIGITSDSNPTIGGFDHEHNSYSAQELARVGALPGDNYNYKLDDGRTLVFTFPNALPGQPNDYVANGQILNIPLNPTTPHANILGLLGATADGDGGGVFTITYTDGTSQQVYVKFTDWCSPVPRFGNEVAITTGYRNPGETRENIGAKIYFVGIPVDSTRTLAKITLPTDINAPTTLHVFAVSANTRAS